ncbi:MAG: RDD family protein, partial [Elusimicrobiota bacterium]
AALGGCAGLATRRLGGSFPSVMEAGFLAWVAYQTLTVGRWGQTIGKMAAGIRITRLDGGRVGYARALGRSFACCASAIPLNLGYLFAAFEPQKRGMHDYLADTRVVFESGAGRGRRALMAGVGASATLLSAAAGIFLCSVALGSFCVFCATLADFGGRNELAADLWGRAIRLMPGSPDPWTGRCWDRALAGQLDGALQDCDQSLRLRRSAAAFDSRGTVLLKMKRYAESIASYSEALAQHPRPSNLLLGNSLYGRGLARAEMGDQTGSEADRLAALNLSPHAGDDFPRFALKPDSVRR